MRAESPPTPKITVITVSGGKSYRKNTRHEVYLSDEAQIKPANLLSSLCESVGEYYCLMLSPNRCFVSRQRTKQRHRHP